MNLVSTQVECRSEGNYADRPVALYWQGQRLEIRSILAEWRTPEGKYFRVSAEDDQTFELIYNEASDAWQIRQL